MSATALVIGSTTISGGTTTRVLFDNAGFLGEYAISGTGNVAMTTSPSFTTPVLGTPSSGNLVNCTGYTIANVAGLGANVGTWLATPSSANLRAAVTDEIGTGALVFDGATFTSLISGPGTLTNLVIRTQEFSASGTYTPNANMRYCIIECWGGGGGGGGSSNNASFGTTGGGGGAGSYSWLRASAATIGSSQTVTIGAAGSAGSAGNNNGGAGGDTSVGSLCIGKGGSAGSGGAGGNSGAGGLGGVAGTGDLAGTGMSGNTGWSGTAAVNSPLTGAGGSTSIGRGGATRGGGASAGLAGSLGGGGAGGATAAGGSDQAGGAGGTGYARVIEFCTA